MGFAANGEDVTFISAACFYCGWISWWWHREVIEVGEGAFEGGENALFIGNQALEGSGSLGLVGSERRADVGSRTDID